MRRRKLNKSPVLGFCGFVIGYECKEKGIKLMECDKAQADAIIVPHHFSHKVTLIFAILGMLFRGVDGINIKTMRYEEKRILRIRPAHLPTLIVCWGWVAV